MKMGKGNKALSVYIPLEKNPAILRDQNIGKRMDREE